MQTKTSLPLSLDKLTDQSKGIISFRLLRRKKKDSLLKLFLNLPGLSCFPLNTYSEIGLKNRPPSLSKIEHVSDFTLARQRPSGGRGTTSILRSAGRFPYI